MTLVKLEKEEEDMECDYWLKSWAGIKEEIKAEEDEEVKRVSLKSEYNDPTKRKLPIKTNKKTNIRAKCETISLSFEEKLDRATVSNRVANLCEYQCPKCDKIYTARESLRCHFKRTNHVSLGEIKQFLVKIVVHLCYFCSKKILCEKEILWKHVKKCHKFNSLKKYSDKTNCIYESLSKKGKKMNDLLAKANITNSVGNLCEYQCKNCAKTYKSRTGLLCHLKNKKETCMYKGDLKNCLSKVTAHKCYVCSKLVLCDSYFILNHLRGHKIHSMLDYSNMSGIKLQSRSVVKKQSIDLFLAKHSDKSEISEKIGNFCEFSCKKCIFSCNNWKGMTKHFRVKMHGSKLSYIKHVTKATLYKCKLCNELILCDYGILYEHLTQNHKMTPTAYRNIANVESEEIFAEFKSKLRKKVKNIPHLSQRLPFTLESNALPDNKVTNHVGNISFFRCSVCKVTNLSYSNWKLHCHRKHQLKMSCIKQHIVEARYHKCQICSAVLLCDNEIVKLHLHKKHKIKFSDYCKNYVIKYGGKVFPTFNEYKSNRNLFETFSMDTNLSQTKDRPYDNGLILPSMISSESEASDEES